MCDLEDLGSDMHIGRSRVLLKVRSVKVYCLALRLVGVVGESSSPVDEWSWLRADLDIGRSRHRARGTLGSRRVRGVRGDGRVGD